MGLGPDSCRLIVDKVFSTRVPDDAGPEMVPGPRPHWLIRALVRSAGHLGEDGFVRLTSWLAPMINWPRRQRRLANLELLSRGMGWSSERRREIHSLHLRYLTRMNGQIFHAASVPVEELLDSISVTGLEGVAQALQNRQGVMVVGAHLGTFFHAPSLLAARGFKVTGILNSQIPDRLLAFFDGQSRRFGIRIAYVGDHAFDTAKAALQRGGVVYTSFDRTLLTDRNVWMPLAGAEIPLNPGTAILALRQRPALFWAESHHDEGGRPHLHFTKSPPMGRGTSFDSIESLLKYWCSQLEGYLRRHPEQWWALGLCPLRKPATTDSPIS